MEPDFEAVVFLALFDPAVTDDFHRCHLEAVALLENLHGNGLHRVAYFLADEILGEKVLLFLVLENQQEKLKQRLVIKGTLFEFFDDDLNDVAVQDNLDEGLSVSYEGVDHL